jgi:hypothetical protein
MNMRFVGLAPLVFMLACGGGNNGTSLTGPSNSIPSVAGSYSGTTTLTLPELAQSVSCPTTTAVTQSGSTVNVAPLVLAGQCGNLSVPLGQFTIDATGAFPGSSSGTYTDPSCGTYNYTASGGFFGRTMRLSVSATSRTCYNFNMTVNLSH